MKYSKYLQVGPCAEEGGGDLRGPPIKGPHSFPAGAVWAEQGWTRPSCRCWRQLTPGITHRHGELLCSHAGFSARHRRDTGKDAVPTLRGGQRPARCAGPRGFLHGQSVTTPAPSPTFKPLQWLSDEEADADAERLSARAGPSRCRSRGLVRRLGAGPPGAPGSPTSLQVRI